MFELDKESFGSFVAGLRKEKGYTQRELAEKLFISDKAVSKWERGLSMPDISLLIPLAELLEVSVLELLEGKRLEHSESITTEQVERLVKRALSFSDNTSLREEQEQSRRQREKHITIFKAAVCLMIWEWIMIFALGYGGSLIYEPDSLWFQASVFILEGMSLGFGVCFWLFMKEELPLYHRKPKVNPLGEEIVRLNLSGKEPQTEILYDKGWPQLLKRFRLWSILTMTLTPLLYVFLLQLESERLPLIVLDMVLVLFLAGIFIPVCMLGKTSYQGVEHDVSERKRRSQIPKMLVVAILLLVMVAIIILWRVSGKDWEAGIFNSWSQVERVAYSGVEEVRIIPQTRDGELVPYYIELEVEQGSISIEITEDSGRVVFSEENMSSGRYSFAINELATVKMTKKDYEGALFVLPEGEK